MRIHRGLGYVEKRYEREKTRMDRYVDIKEKIIKYASHDNDIAIVIAIGSSTREEVKADEYSDLDLIIVSENPDRWYCGEYPKLLGNVSISFIEPTLGGGKERRCIYDEDRDVDMIIFTPTQFNEALKAGVASWVMNRGYEVLYADTDIEKEISKYVKKGHSNPDMTEEEFENMLNDFYFHNIWASKKLLRGELWSAKMCVDAYLKNYLLKAMELYCCEIEGKDVWHDGRFIDKWAGVQISNKIRNCFAHYEKSDVMNALKATNILFEELTRKIAVKKGYTYPDKAAKCAAEYLEKIEI